MSGYLVCDSVFTRHKTGPSHPEGPDRITVIREGINEVGSQPWSILEPDRKASVEDLTRVHDSDYIQTVEGASVKGRSLDADTPVSEQSYDIARLAAGSALELADRGLRNEGPGFGVIRPPGHHAEPHQGMGFCLFNNVAIVSSYLAEHGHNVAVVDIDVHHGNGTQKAFYARDDVLYVSFHQHPFYPGSGREDETGQGEGDGLTVNVPLPARSNWTDLKPQWNGEIKDAIYDFDPSFLLVSAGFDAHVTDPIGGLNLEDEDYYQIASDLRLWADELCDGRLGGFLEGGYNRQTLRRIVPEFIRIILTD